MMTEAQKRSAAKEFAAYWKGKGYEKGESQPFWISLLSKVYGVENPEQFITFEDQVKLDHTSFIDGSIPATHVLIEQKSVDKDLRKSIKQADGSFLTPFQQAKRYAAELPYSSRPRWIVTCNFQEFLIYDMERPSSQPESVLLENLEKESHRLNFLVDIGDETIRKEMEVSIAAGNLVGRLYDNLSRQYRDPQNPESLKSLNMLCVRLVFCLYAEDSGIFGRHGQFHHYLNRFEALDIRRALIDLFRVLDTPPEKRDPYLVNPLAAFPYVNGGLFSDENIEIPHFTDTIKQLLLQNASENFNWSEISPTIFGAVFESTLNPETRRTGGMHYTSIENIHRVIDPLFLDDLREELATILEIPIDRTRQTRLQAFQQKLASLSFLDPACGSGNFLTETYLCLRRMENQVIRALLDLRKGQVATEGQIVFGDTSTYSIKVSIGQFYGIEVNDFAVTVARTALWIAEAQMLSETELVVHMNLDFLPLKTYANIHEANALRLDWESVVPKHQLHFIMGNPPFSGARIMGESQKADMLHVFGKASGTGNLDYVAAWYQKAAEYAAGTTVRVAFVSTNSITQGEQPPILWKPLMAKGIHIDFAWQTFKWSSQSNDSAAVHCVIIGFSATPARGKRRLYLSEMVYHEASNINAYLSDAPDVFVESRNTALCAVPKIGVGNQPIDGGFYLFTKDEMEAFATGEPQSRKWFRPWIGSHEFINRYYRYCLWLGDCPPDELRAMPQCMKRVEAVRLFRLSRDRSVTKKLADTPRLFAFTNMPTTPYIVIPEVSSERRRYIPMGFFTPDVLCSNLVKLIPDATLYHFGILTSNIHMAWMRAVAGRLKSDYRYSANIVYNNFPWPSPTPEQKRTIEQPSQAILDSRALSTTISLADLYDEYAMPPELRKAHKQNDRAVIQAYGFPPKISEPECVSALMKQYQQLVAPRT